MVFLKIASLLLVAVATIVNNNDLTGSGLRQLEKELIDRLRWEIIWNESPLDFKVTNNGSAQLVAYQTDKTFSYCSRDFGVCAQYLLEDRHLGDRVKSIKYVGGLDEKSQVLKLAGSPQKTLYPKEIETDKLPRPSGILWSVSIKIGSRKEIADQYRRSPDIELKKLRRWLFREYRDAGYRSLTIACFAPSDPTIFVYGVRKMNQSEGIVFQLFWNKEREEWVEAGLLKQSQNPRKFEVLKTRVKVNTCSTIKFK